MKALSTYILVFWGLISFIAINSCSGDKSDSKDSEELTGSIVAEELGNDSKIIISKEQFENAKMEIGSPSLFSFMQSVKAKGYIEASPLGLARIGAPIEGKVSSIKVTFGQKVIKGQPLFSLESNDIILLQQEYAENCSQLQLLKNNLERIKSLSEDNITARKDLKKAESEYKTMLSTNEGLKARLKIIGVNPQDVEAGIIHSKALVSSPINGHVSELNFVLGQYLQPGESKLELVNLETLQLVLHVFEKDINLLEEGQVIKFHSPGKHFEEYSAILSKIGKSIDEESRTVTCLASIEDKALESFLPHSFVESEIVTCERKALALPRTALLEEDERYYILYKIDENDRQLAFRKIPVKIGTIQKEMAEVLEDDLNNILVKGVYYLSGD